MNNECRLGVWILSEQANVQSHCSQIFICDFEHLFCSVRIQYTPSRHLLIPFQQWKRQGNV